MNNNVKVFSIYLKGGISMSNKISMKQALGTFLVVTFLAGGLTLAAASKVHASPKGDAQLTAPVVVNINKAGAEDLDQIRGIGPVMAKRILEFREQNGPFKSVDDLAQVRGIGGSKLQRIKDQIKV